MNPKEHWEGVYTRLQPQQVSWFQPEARLSLELIQRARPDRATRIIDVGGGASRLVDGLLAEGYATLTVMDLSGIALQRAQERLGAAAGRVRWVEADVLHAEMPAEGFDLWHDRAVFHFLTDPQDRARYIAQVEKAVAIGGHVLVATFAEDGPEKCSGLTVARYSADALHAEFGADFRLLESRRELHVTPAGRSQSFTYCVCRLERRSASRAA